MSALTPHIRVLRAEAEALAVVSSETKTIAVAHVLMALAEVKTRAAAYLEAAEPSLPEDEHPITYDPKGKR